MHLVFGNGVKGDFQNEIMNGRATIFCHDGIARKAMPPIGKTVARLTSAVQQHLLWCEQKNSGRAGMSVIIHMRLLVAINISVPQAKSDNFAFIVD